MPSRKKPKGFSQYQVRVIPDNKIHLHIYRRTSPRPSASSFYLRELTESQPIHIQLLSMCFYSSKNIEQEIFFFFWITCAEYTFIFFMVFIDALSYLHITPNKISVARTIFLTESSGMCGYTLSIA